MKKTTYTFESIQSIALQYKTRKDFRKNNYNAYAAAARRGIDNFTKHMEWKGGVNWTDELLQKEANKYKTRSEFFKGSPSAYVTASAKGINNFTQHMQLVRIKWTNKLIQKEANKYGNIKDLIKENYSLYQAMILRGIYNFTKHMDWRCKIRWTKELIQNEAKKYKTRGRFRRANFHAYNAATIRGIDNFTGHMFYEGKGFKKDRPGILYYLSVENGTAFKIGITNLSVKERYYASDLEKIEIIKEWYYEDGAEAYKNEQLILKEFKEALYHGDPLLSSGNSELFRYDVLGYAE